MAYRLPSDRVAIALPDGPSVEVERLAAWPLYRAALLWCEQVFGEDESAKATALGSLLGTFVVMGQPTFAIIDHLGVVPMTREGLMRLPLNLSLGMVLGWMETFQKVEVAAEEPQTAADVLPPGDLREAVKARLRQKRAA